jgi:carotenoid cleavage dioxygenase
LSWSFEICIVTANAWEEGDEVVLITCRLENPDLDKVNGHQSDKLENFGNELCVPAI